MITYFAYGSNMSLRRMKSRVPSSRMIGSAKLPAHRLVFHKISTKDGSAKCNILPSSTDVVYGVLFEFNPGEKKDLDRYEGLGDGYEEKFVDVELRLGEHIRATTYYATNTDPLLKPFSWYKRHVLEGALGAALPDVYIQMIEQVEEIRDPDPERVKRELEIYS